MTRNEKRRGVDCDARDDKDDRDLILPKLSKTERRRQRDASGFSIRPRASQATPLLLLLAIPVFADSPADFPLATEIRVGQSFAYITPALAVPVETPTPAPAKLKLTSRTASFKKGEEWGLVDEDRLALEKQRLELARAQLVRKEKNDADAGLAKAELERRLQEIDVNLAAMENRDDSALDDVEGGEKFREQLRKRTAEAKASLLKQKGLLAEKLAGLDGARAEELENLRLALRGKEMEYARLNEAAHLKMPCDGIVTLMIEPRADGRYDLRPGRPFATVEDRSRYFVRIVVGAQPWRVLQATRLKVVVRSGDNVLRAGWYASEVVKNYGRDEPSYLFEVTRDSAPAAAALSGGSALAEIFYGTGTPVRLVPKLAFAAAHPEAFDAGADWAGAVRRAWPGYRMAAEGLGDIGVVKEGP